MSNAASAWAWKQTLDCHAQHVLLALADHADDRGICWPGLWGLAEKSNMPRRTIQRKVRQLEALGLLRTDPGKGQHGTSLYHLNLSLVLAGKSKPLEGGDTPPPLQHNEGASPCRPGRQPRHPGGDTLPPESSEENHQKKEKRREDPSFPPQRGGTAHQLASIDWIVSEWKKIPGVFNLEPLPAESNTAKAITRELRTHPGCAWWRELFAAVRDSPFLRRECEPGPGRPRWRASLGWLLRPENLAKTLEGNYRPHPDDRPSVRGRFNPSGTLAWVARKEAEREREEAARSRPHSETVKESGGRAVAPLVPVWAHGEAENNEVRAPARGPSSARGA